MKNNTLQTLAISLGLFTAGFVLTSLTYYMLGAGLVIFGAVLSYSAGYQQAVAEEFEIRSKVAKNPVTVDEWA